MGARVTWLASPLARIAAIIEGAYPDPPVAGRSVPAGTFKPSLLHGDLRDAAFPGAHYQRAYNLVVEDSGDAPDDPPNLRAGSMRATFTLRVDVGYIIGRDAPRLAAGEAGTLLDPSALGHSDHEAIRQALAWAGNWSGTTPEIVGLLPRKGDRARTETIAPVARIIVSRRYDLLLSFAPGSVIP